MYFDGSDVGLPVEGIRDFTLLSDGSILLSLAKAVKMSDLGRVRPEDILRFIPSSTGQTTSGTFQMYFDGSDVSLTSGGEAIDAFSFDAAGRLIISTKGASIIKNPSSMLKSKNHDLLSFTFGTTGGSTSGSWAFYFDGSDVGLGKENIDSLWIDPINGDIYLSVVNSFSVSGASGGGGTIFVCDPGTLGDTTSCSYSRYWDVVENGLNVNITGLYIQR